MRAEKAERRRVTKDDREGLGKGMAPVRVEGRRGPNDALKHDATQVSYQDKLLSPRYAGFLVQHSVDDDIVQGWKSYFHQMNEKEGRGSLAESDEEDDQETRRLEGKPGVLKFTADEYSAWCLPWKNALIIKVLGANFPTYIICDRINRIWHPWDPLKLIPLTNGYFIVSFSNKEDREYAFQEGPWMIEDHYLIVQRWRPNFNPWKANLQCNIAAWVRLPDVPFEFYNAESLHRIDRKMIRVDRSTSIYDKGGLAQICVEIDLRQPLLPSYTVFGEERPIIYEGLHRVNEQSKGDIGAKEVVGEQLTEGSGVAAGRPTIVTGDEKAGECPFGKIRILRRDFRGANFQADIKPKLSGDANKKHVINEGGNQNVDKRKSRDSHETRQMDMQKE
ncbi:hypothetical protein K1719_025811 [Acacia pycnantha]|nr:hypothetical protein K1719_025811 [Acacia pycnantha]